MKHEFFYGNLEGLGTWIWLCNGGIMKMDPSKMWAIYIWINLFALYVYIYIYIYVCVVYYVFTAKYLECLAIFSLRIECPRWSVIFLYFMMLIWYRHVCHTRWNQLQLLPIPNCRALYSPGSMFVCILIGFWCIYPLVIQHNWHNYRKWPVYRWFTMIDRMIYHDLFTSIQKGWFSKC